MNTPAVQTNRPAPVAASLQNWLSSDNVKQKFIEVLDKGANGFISSLLSLVKSTPQLAEADPKTVLSAAMTAATLKLPINPNLGLAYIIPYRNKGVMQAQFQMGWKGFVQLAERSAQYRTINTSIVYEGQIKDIDFITGEIIRGTKTSDKVIGYVAYIELVNGFKKTLYMSREDMEAHARQYSKSYGYDVKNGKKSSVWSTNFDAMAQKTVLKLIISKYGIMSIDMHNDGMTTALQSDQAVIHAVGESYEYIDNDDTISVEDTITQVEETAEEEANQVDIPLPDVPAEKQPTPKIKRHRKEPEEQFPDDGPTF